MTKLQFNLNIKCIYKSNNYNKVYIPFSLKYRMLTSFKLYFTE